jgi:predicted transcriptional regulator
MVSLKKAMDVPENIRHEVNVEEILIPSNDLIIMKPDRKADVALIQMTQKHSGKLFVCSDGKRQLLGLISKTEIMNVASERKEYVNATNRS